MEVFCFVVDCNNFEMIIGSMEALTLDRVGLGGTPHLKQIDTRLRQRPRRGRAAIVALEVLALAILFSNAVQLYHCI